MTDFVSGFLGPEERATFRLREEHDAVPPITSDLALTVLHHVASQGSTKMPELLAGVQARPRSVVAAIDELEHAGLLKVVVDGQEETVEPTAAGLRAIAT